MTMTAVLAGPPVTLGSTRYEGSLPIESETDFQSFSQRRSTIGMPIFFSLPNARDEEKWTTDLKQWTIGLTVETRDCLTIESTGWFDRIPIVTINTVSV